MIRSITLQYCSKDVVGFTTHTSALGAGVVVQLMQEIFTTFDGICAKHDVMKIKTIGDSYMAVAFPSASNAADLADVARATQSSAFTWPHTGHAVTFRIGLHCGPVTAGVIGTERLQYDVWGDTVNVASRMESTGEPGRIHISEAFACALTNLTPLELERGGAEGAGVSSRGTVEIKGKGPMTTYWLETHA